MMGYADRFFLALALCLGFVPLWNPRRTTEAKARIQRQPFGKTPDQKVIDLYTLTNAHGVEARITNYGGILVSLKAPDRNGKLADVVLGFDDPEGYLKNNTPYFGAVIGRGRSSAARRLRSITSARMARKGIRGIYQSRSSIR